jgi:mediator of RNA polymerase II transcription subunit 8
LISNNLKSVSDQLKEHQDLLSSAVVYPLPQFPGRTQEHILQQLLRTKLEPGVEEWVERGQDLANTSQNRSYYLSDNDMDQLWDSAPRDATKEGMKQKWGADYTLAEIQMGVENIKTGLTRELKIPEDDDNEEAMEDDEKGEDEASDEEDEDVDKMEVVEVQRKAGSSGLQNDLSDRPPVAPPMPLENVFRFMMTGSS